jgi:hypothetical protein
MTISGYLDAIHFCADHDRPPCQWIHVRIAVFLAAILGTVSGKAVAAEPIPRGASSPLHVSTPVPEPFFEDFTREGKLRPGWTLTEPNPASRHELSPEGLLMLASGENGGSDISSWTDYNGSTLLRAISPDQDWTIVTHLLFVPSIDFQGAGLFLAREPGRFNTSSRFHRFELSYQNRQNGLAVASYNNGPVDPKFVRYEGNEIYLKVCKHHSSYTYSFSSNGTSWQPVATLTDTNDYTYVGLDSIRQPWHGSPSVSSRPVFKSFRLEFGRSCNEPVISAAAAEHDASL